MTLQEFINKYNNKPLEWVDSTNKYQCFDLVAAWIEEGMGYPRLTNGLLHAYQIYTNPTSGLKTHFDLIANTPTGVPSPGDIIVWSNKYGSSGHTAIVVDANVDTFRAFSQNDPIGTYCTIRTYNYSNVLGWLHNKAVASDPLAECLRLHGEAVKELTELKEQFQKDKESWLATEKRLKEEKDSAVKELEQKLIEKENTLQNVNQLVNEKNNIISKLQSTISTQESQLLDCESRLSSLEEQAKKVPILQEQIGHLEQSKETWGKLEKKYLTTIKKLEETSYTTAPTATLLAEVVKRTLQKLSIT